MAIMMRTIQHVRPGRWNEAMELEKRWDAYERRTGGRSPKRRYQSMVGSEDQNTFVEEREWESLAAVEASYLSLVADPDPEAVELRSKLDEVYSSIQHEIYLVLP